ncbi:hypothetical protein ACJMK2_027694 [Sinanodonta woodiana]|uniref:Uncharacterized protein n=1 Tax=Sinanodonta woodiana TaxID=1069815 RepID=A0ABD3X6X2_SINWO
MEKTTARITAALYWPEMFGDIQRHCHKKVKSSHDKNSRKRKFRPGDEVLVLLQSDTSRMKARWKRPYNVICKKVIGVNYKINVGGRRRQVTYHSNLLRQYKKALLLTATICFEFDGGGQIKLNDAKVRAMADLPFPTTKGRNNTITTVSEMVPVSTTVHNQTQSGSEKYKC